MMIQTQKNEGCHFVSIIRDQYFDWGKVTAENADLQSRKSQYFRPQHTGTGFYCFSRIECILFLLNMFLIN